MAQRPATVFEQMRSYRDFSDPRSGPMYVKPGKNAEHERGVLFQGPWEIYADGFCEHVRRLARSLSLAGVAVHLRSAIPRHRSPSGEDRLVDKLYGDLLFAKIASYVTQVQMVVPTPGVLPSLVTHRWYSVDQLKYINDRRTICTVWERQSGVHPDDVVALNSAASSWVGTPSAVELLAEAGVERERLHWVPCPFLPDDPHLALNGRKRRPGPVRFYHVGKWEPRKEQRQLIGAFLRAFRPGQAMLMLKTSEKSPPLLDYPTSPMEALRGWITDEAVLANGWTPDNLDRGVRILAKRLSGEQMVQLHSMGDCYVTLSRGEGFDMPAFDSKLAGNLMVYTPSGGPQTFCGELDELVPQTGSVDCHPFYEWPDDATYLDYDMDAAVAALRNAAESVRKGDRCRGMDVTPFSALSVGRKMRELLERIAGDLS